MSFPAYKNSAPVDCSTAIDYSKLQGKNVIVTGGSSGLGAEFSKLFLQSGATVTIGDIKEPPETLKSEGLEYVKCDTLSWEDQVQLFKTAASRSPKNSVDVVVASAGVSGPDGFHDYGDGEPVKPSLRILEVNLLGVVYTAKLAVHYFNQHPWDADHDRSLILVSSIMGFLNTNGSPTYSASKFGVRGLMGCLRRTANIRSNLIAPWYVATPLMSKDVIDTLQTQLTAQGSDWAHIQDAAKAVARIATDTSITGRSFAILPRIVKPEGHVDLDLDDFEEGSMMAGLQTVCNGLSHRRLPLSLQ